ncbi:helix-turn-helix domain-containing protein [Nocardia fluminea]|uniref:helix-turn-helix domain-containing protein n=1 Tax=Nocardia fluminea TaxID=134984 RepID=UPI00364794C6
MRIANARHASTIDHRLKRIAVVTGLDAARADGQWALRAALVARTFPLPPSPTTETGGADEHNHHRTATPW